MGTYAFEMRYVRFFCPSYTAINMRITAKCANVPGHAYADLYTADQEQFNTFSAGI
jgi:hypothetical protein